MTDSGKEKGTARIFCHGASSGKFTIFDKSMIGKAREGDVGFFGKGFQRQREIREMKKPASAGKEIGVSAGAGQHQHQDAMIDTVDEQPIRTDMALAKTGEIA